MDVDAPRAKQTGFQSRECGARPCQQGIMRDDERCACWGGGILHLVQKLLRHLRKPARRCSVD
eukprot:362265-Chlamydomonas_euryale.AAC.21